MVKKSLIPVVSLLAAITFFSCEHEKFTEKGIPEVETLGVTLLQDGVTFHGEVLSDADMEITDHGFTWVPSANKNSSEVQYYRLGPLEKEYQFYATVNSAIEKDKEYLVRAYITAGQITSYGNEVIFSGIGSKPSELVSVTPASAQIGDTVVIRGNYFSGNPASCKVYFGNTSAAIITSAINELKVVVPYVKEPTVSVRVVVTGIMSSNTLSFNILLPILTEIVPPAAASGDTVVIRGNYLRGNLSACSVFFGPGEARVLSMTPTEIRAVVPYAPYSSAPVSVITNGISTGNTIIFNFLKPEPLGIAPVSGTFGDIVNLYGNNLPTDTTFFRVFFNNAKALVKNVSKTRIQVEVPAGNNVSPAIISLKYYSSYAYTDQFTLHQAIIDDVSPVFLSERNTITIRGSYFNPDPDVMIVEIGGREARIISSSENEVRVELPVGISSGTYQVSVTTISGSPVTWDGSIEYVTAWSRMADFPEDGRVGGAGFTIGDRIFFGTGYEEIYNQTNDFWEYYPLTDSWSRKADYPLSLAYATGFSIDGTGYFAIGKQSSQTYTYTYSYNPQSDTWSQMASKPGDGSTMDAPGFVIDGKAYVPAAGRMYMYDPVTNAWTEKSYPNELGYFGGGVAFSINGKGYLGIGWVHDKGADVADFFEYDPSSDTWTKKASFPGALRDNAISFALPNGKGYLGMGLAKPQMQTLNDMWEYDPVTDAWTRIGDFPGLPRCAARAYVVGSEAYIISGTTGVYQRDMWRFSPLN